jgi:hypothetical protein
MLAEVNEIISVPSIDVPYYFKNLLNFLTGSYPSAFYFINSIKGWVLAICIILSVVFLIGIIISVEGIKNVRKKEDEIYNKPIEIAYTEDKEIDEELGKRWNKILSHIDSPNQNDWKQAIIDADTILDNLITKLGYRGESLGEKLKRVNKGDFKSLDEAWEAHKIRNAIAHGGSDFSLNQLEAKKVIDLYKKVFEEFYHISI